jgi:hypothetical protein
VFEADMSAVLADRAQRREAFAREGVPLTLTAYFVRAAVAAIRAVPEANSRWTDSALELYEQVHVGIATAVEGTGLVVPVLRDAGARDLLETARGLEELVRRARGHLRPADVRGGTFTPPTTASAGVSLRRRSSSISRRRRFSAWASSSGARWWWRRAARRPSSCSALLCVAHPRSLRQGRPPGRSLHTVLRRHADSLGRLVG